MTPLVVLTRGVDSSQRATCEPGAVVQAVEDVLAAVKNRKPLPAR